MNTPMPPAASFPLCLAQEGEQVRLVSLMGGPGVMDRLAGMGLRPGAELRILCNSMDGTLAVVLGATRLVLGGGMARKIQAVIIEGAGK